MSDLCPECLGDGFTVVMPRRCPESDDDTEPCQVCPLCFDCGLPAPVSGYVSRAGVQQRVCEDCYVESGDDALVAHAGYCRCEPRCSRPDQ